MNHTNIEYLVNPDGTKGYCWNFYTGCRHTLKECPCADKCWAKTGAHRFGRSYEPTLHPEKILEPLSLKKPSRIGVCFTGDLFGEWVDPEQIIDIPEWHDTAHLSSAIFGVVRASEEHQFFFLTKAPWNYLKWGKFPDNAWVGATVCNEKTFLLAWHNLLEVKAKNKWLSIEPLISHVLISAECLKEGGISWVVIGGWSGGKNPPKIEWVKEIVEACDKAGVRVWIKNNLVDAFHKDIRYSLESHTRLWTSAG